MGKYIRTTRAYLIVIAIFIVLRFGLEAFGPGTVPTFYQPMEMSYITDELSVTRLLFILPVFLGIRLARQGAAGWKEIVLPNLTYVVWGIGLVDLLHMLDGWVLKLGTHYGRGTNRPHLMGHVYDLKMWISRRPSAEFSFCASILLMTLLTSLICLITIRLNRPGKESGETAA